LLKNRSFELMSIEVVKLIQLALEPSMLVFQLSIAMCVLAICECVSLINHDLFLLLTRVV